MDADILVKTINDWWTANAPTWAKESINHVR